MKHTLLKPTLLLLSITFSLSLFSQDKSFLRHEFSVHTGYGKMLYSPAGLTMMSPGYKHSLSNGVSWDGQYHFRFIRYMALGLVYSGFSSQKSHAEGSDHLFIHYLAPQISVGNASNKRCQVRFGLGMGALYYRDNSEVFGKPRRVTARTAGTNMSFSMLYKLTRHWGAGIEIQYLQGRFSQVDSHYHDETILVEFKGENEGDISRLNIVAGLSYQF